MNAKIFNVINNAKAGSFASVVTLTSVKLPKKLGFQAEVKKYTYKWCQLNFSYESAVNRRLTKEGKTAGFEAQALPWGEWLIPNKVIAHKGEIYYRIYDIKNGVIKQVYYVGDRQATDEETGLIKAYLNGLAKSSRQGLEDGNEVKPTTVKESSILHIKCGTSAYNEDVTELPLALAEVFAVAR